MGGLSSEISLTATTDFSFGEPRSGSYTGDGTAGRKIETASAPTYVVVRNSDGAFYDVHAKWGRGYRHNAPSGTLSIVSGGFEVGDNSSGSDPNKSGETYQFFVE